MTIFEKNRELLERFRRGDRSALTEVYERYVDDVATLARRGFTMESDGRVRVPGVDPDAERELVQETFLKAFNDAARAAFDGLRPYRPFLLRVTKNLMIDRFRARRKEGRRDDGVGLGDIDELLDANGPLAMEPDREEDLDWKKLSAVTATFVAGLDAEAREIVRLRFEEDLSQDACAATLGCSRRRVRTLEDRVQKRLEKHLKQLGLFRS